MPVEGCKRSIQRIGLRSWLFVGVYPSPVQGFDGGRVDSARQPAWVRAGPTTTTEAQHIQLGRDPVMKCFTPSLFAVSAYP
jgi:hypothetical protein